MALDLRRRALYLNGKYLSRTFCLNWKLFFVIVPAMLELAYISSREAAHLLGKTPRRVNQLVSEGILAGRVVGNSNVIEKASVLRLRKFQQSQRNKKQSNGNGRK